MNTLADRIKGRREELGLSRDELAALAGVSRQAIWYWERGDRKPSFLAIRLLSSALGVSPEHLLAGDVSGDGRFIQPNNELENINEHSGDTG
jgi:transcriptional regulator with XRE-family HTH domain